MNEQDRVMTQTENDLATLCQWQSMELVRHPELLNALGAQVAAQTKALDECQRQLEKTRHREAKAFRWLQEIIFILEEPAPWADELTPKETVALRCAKKAMNEAPHYA